MIIIITTERKMIRRLYTDNPLIADTVDSCHANKRFDRHGNQLHDSVTRYFKGDIRPHFNPPALIAEK